MATVAFRDRGGRRTPGAVSRGDRQHRHDRPGAADGSGGTTLEESRSACGAKVQAAETSVEALLAHGKPDMAIVTMIGAHAPAVIEPLLEAGVHVMAEKPSCVHPDRFERLVQVAERRGVHLMMAFAQRRDPVKVDAPADHRGGAASDRCTRCRRRR